MEQDLLVGNTEDGSSEDLERLWYSVEVVDDIPQCRDMQEGEVLKICPIVPLPW